MAGRPSRDASLAPQRLETTPRLAPAGPRRDDRQMDRLELGLKFRPRLPGNFVGVAWALAPPETDRLLFPRVLNARCLP
jgi:hypothetical protein